MTVTAFDCTVHMAVCTTLALSHVNGVLWLAKTISAGNSMRRPPDVVRGDLPDIVKVYVAIVLIVFGLTETVGAEAKELGTATIEPALLMSMSVSSTQSVHAVAVPVGFVDGGATRLLMMNWMFVPEVMLPVFVKVMLICWLEYTTPVMFMKLGVSCVMNVDPW